MKIQWEEGCIEGTEEMTGSLTNLLHDKFYWRLLQGLDVHEIDLLLGDDPLNLLFVYSHTTRSVERDTFAIPSLVLFLLGFRHKKRRYSGDKLLGLEVIVRNVGEAMNKIRWKAFFKNSENRRHKCPRALLFPRKCARFCKQSEPEVNNVCYVLGSCILNAAHSARSRASAAGRK